MSDQNNNAYEFVNHISRDYLQFICWAYERDPDYWTLLMKDWKKKKYHLTDRELNNIESKLKGKEGEQLELKFNE